MRYAFMSFSTPQLTLDEILAQAKKLGYVGVEPRAQSKHAHGIEFDATAEQRRTIRAKAHDAGIALCCLAVSCNYSDPATVKQHVEDTRKAIDLAGDCGIPRLRVFGGKLGAGLDRAAATAHAAEHLTSLMPLAQQRGVTLCLETHDDWCDPAHVVALIQAVNHPNLAVNWDIMHPVRVAKKTMDEAFTTLKPYIRHVHIHDGVTTAEGKLNMVPIGTGAIDHGRALTLLKSLQYDGYVSGEWINWEPWETHLPRELAKLKELEARA